MSYLSPDPDVPGAFRVAFGDTQQSWVDPSRPDFLAYEYVQQVAIILDHTVLRAEADTRLRVVHLGGGGLTIPRWVAWRRPQTAQVVCEPNVALTDEVRRTVPLPRRSGIKVRDVDGRSGLAAMPDEWADAVVIDAFDGARVPADLVTAEAFDEVRRVVRGQGVVILNCTDRAPFDWARRAAAAVQARWRHALVGADPSVHKGRRFGNLLLVGALQAPDAAGITRASAGVTGGYRWLTGREARRWPGGAEPFTDEDAAPSPGPGGSKLWLGG